MRRTQVLLEDRQHRALLSLSRRSGRGISEIIRGAIDRLLGGEEIAGPSRKLSDIRAIARDPGGPPAADHDRTLYGKDS